MTMTPSTPGAEGAVGPDLGPINDRVRAALDAVAETVRALPRLDAARAGRARRELARLMEAAQLRDAFDQRMSHVEAALERAGGLDPAGRAAVDTVVAQQLMELSVLLENGSARVSSAIRAIADAGAPLQQGAEDAAMPGAEAAVARHVRSGFETATSLAAAAEVLGATAAGHAGRVDAGVSPAAIREADLDWMFALYTMEEERSIHRRAIAQVGLVA